MIDKINNAKDKIIIEIWNAISHGIGVVLGIVFLVMLILKSVYKDNVTAVVAYSIYGACFILMFLMSTLYHAIQNKKAKSVFKVFDHISIFYFIAGSFTPPILLLTESWIRIVFIVFIWTLAILGTIYNVVIKNKFEKYKKIFSIFISCYGMGWSIFNKADYR